MDYLRLIIELQRLQSGLGVSRSAIPQSQSTSYQKYCKDRQDVGQQILQAELSGIECYIDPVSSGWFGYVTIPKNHPDRKCSLDQLNAIYHVHNGISFSENGRIGFITGSVTEFNPKRYTNTRSSSELRKPYRSLQFVQYELSLLAAQIALREENYRTLANEAKKRGSSADNFRPARGTVPVPPKPNDPFSNLETWIKQMRNVRGNGQCENCHCSSERNYTSPPKPNTPKGFNENDDVDEPFFGESRTSPDIRPNPTINDFFKELFDARLRSVTSESQTEQNPPSPKQDKQSSDGRVYVRYTAQTTDGNVVDKEFTIPSKPAGNEKSEEQQVNDDESKSDSQCSSGPPSLIDSSSFQGSDEDQ